jgi:cytochrome c biogenesis protein CcmG/thiol:disulfide interchange protein DsbE
MNIKQLVSVLVALVVSLSLAVAAWWLVWSIGFASIAGGMAGGSADAAGALLACDALWNLATPREDLMRLAAERRVPLYGVSYKDAAPDSRRFLAQLGDPYAAIGWDGNGRVAIDWGVYGVPETFVIDRHGRIRHRHVGPLTEDALAKTIRPLIARLEVER